MASRAFKDEIYSHLARIGKAVSSPRRLELLDLLCQGPRTVEPLAGLAGLSIANTSQHLQVLRSARLVESDRQGTYVIYRIAQPEVCGFLSGLRMLAESRLAEIQQVANDFHESRGTMERITREELAERVRRGEVMILDVRPREEYLAGHIPGAVSIPLNDLERRVNELPPDRQVVAYCRGPYCVLAVEAVAVLKGYGIDAIRMSEGVIEWAEAGLPVAREAS